MTVQQIAARLHVGYLTRQLTLAEIILLAAEALAAREAIAAAPKKKTRKSA